MKATGIVRRLDDLGRVVVPKELRLVLGWSAGSPVEIFTEGETVLLRQYVPLCVFCGKDGEMRGHLGKRVCRHCRALLGTADLQG